MDERWLKKEIWVVILEGEDLNEPFLTKLGMFIEKGQIKSTYSKPASVYEEFDEIGRSERCKDRSMW
jgi:hypothetical protein